MSFYTENGGELCYSIVGSGSKKLFLVGGLGSKRNDWEMQINYFVSTGDYTVCAYDSRGLGQSTMPDNISSWLTTDMARDLMCLLDHIHWTKDIHVVGLSLGGMILQHLVLFCPNRFTTATIISAHGGNRILLPHGQTIAHVGDAVLSQDGRYQWDKILRLMFSERYLAQRINGVQRIEILIDRYADNMHQYRNVLFQHIKACALHTLSQKAIRNLSKSNEPNFLVIVGTSDKIFRYPTILDFGKNIRAKTVILSGAGHCCHQECAEQVNEAIHKFITETCIANGSHVFTLANLRKLADLKDS